MKFIDKNDCTGFGRASQVVSRSNYYSTHEQTCKMTIEETSNTLHYLSRIVYQPTLGRPLKAYWALEGMRMFGRPRSFPSASQYTELTMNSLSYNFEIIKVSIRSRIHGFRSGIEDEYPSPNSPPNDEDTLPSLPLACAFAHGKIHHSTHSYKHQEILTRLEMHHGKYLAVTDEDGFISIYDTATRLSTGPQNIWKAHDNAIFDIAWTFDDELLVCVLLTDKLVDT